RRLRPRRPPADRKAAHLRAGAAPEQFARPHPVKRWGATRTTCRRVYPAPETPIRFRARIHIGASLCRSSMAVSPCCHVVAADPHLRSLATPTADHIALDPNNGEPGGLEFGDRLVGGTGVGDERVDALDRADARECVHAQLGAVGDDDDPT